MDTHIKSGINEIDRVVIRLPDDATFYSSTVFVPVVVDLVDSLPIHSLLSQEQHRINYGAQYEIFSRLCSDRAQKAVDGELLVSGAQVTPERYLGIWREAIAGAISPAQAAKQHGIHVVAILRAPIATVRDAVSGWTSCPFGTFSNFQAEFAKRCKLAKDGTFTLALDLVTPSHARAAFYAASMIARAFKHDASSLWQTSLEVRSTALSQRTPSPSQQSLFAGEEV